MQPFIRFILFSLLFPAASSMAQQPLTIRGQVVNARSGEPLPGSSVSIPALGLHTLTNDQGLFVLKLPSQQAADCFVVSHVGYGTRRFRIDRDATGRYPLTEQSLSLPAFQVNSISPRSLIEKAVQHIPANYLSKPHVLHGFYRLTSRKDGDYFHLSEAAFDCWHPDGSGRQRKLRLLKARMEKDVTPFNGSDNIIIGMQPGNILEFDFPANISEHPVLGRKGLTEHQFSFAGTTTVQGRPAWKINFDQRSDLRKSRYKGAVYIDTTSNAFVLLESYLSPKGIRYWEVASAGQRALMQLLNIHEKMLQDTLTIAYQPAGDKFTLASAKSTSRLRLYSPRLRFDFQALSRVDFVITGIDTTPSLPFSEAGVLARQSFIERHSAIDTTDFWKDYNYLLPDFNTDSVAMAIRSRQSTVWLRKELETCLRKMPRDPLLRIDSVLTFYHTKGMFHGVAAVQRNGAPYYAKAFGMANRERNIPNDTATVFRIGSVSKQFTAMLIMLLREEGKLTLEDTAGKFLPGFAHGAVTIEQLLTHRSGIPDYSSSAAYLPEILSGPIPVADIVRRFCQDSLSFSPGSQFRYSNSGYAVLAAIAEKAAGMPFEQALDSKIFSRLDMRHTRYGTAPDSGRIAKGYEGPQPELTYPAANMPGCGGIWSSAPDLRKWEAALVSCRLLPCDRIDSMLLPRSDYADWHAGYGYGWMTDRMLFNASRRHTVQYHPGTDAGFYSMEVRQPDRGITITLLCNNGDFPRFDITDLLLDILN